MFAGVGIVEAVHGLGLIVRCLDPQSGIGIRQHLGRGKRRRRQHGKRQRCAEENG